MINISDFKPVTNLTEEQKYKLERTQEEFQRLAEVINDFVPSSAHQQAALRLLLEAKFTAIHAITHAAV